MGWSPVRRFIVPLVLLVLPAVSGAQDKALAVFGGFVVDSAQRPVANAEVAIAGLDLKASTDDKGAFRLKDVPAGIHRVTVRHLGYAQLDTLMVFGDQQVVERRITLGASVVTLDSIVAESRVTDPIMLEFEENRARGFGRFLGADDLAKMTVRPLGSAVQQLQGLEVVRGNSGQGWVSGRRGTPTHCPQSVMNSGPTGPTPQSAAAAQEATDQCLRRERLYYVPDPAELAQGVKRVCYAVVYVDRHIMNSGRPTPPFDLNIYVAEQLIGFEWYADVSQAPAQYSRPEAQCGVAILHLKKGK
jgi:hypothetical protein